VRTFSSATPEAAEALRAFVSDLSARREPFCHLTDDQALLASMRAAEFRKPASLERELTGTPTDVRCEP
jgi:hypothetical protein